MGTSPDDEARAVEEAVSGPLGRAIHDAAWGILSRHLEQEGLALQGVVETMDQAHERLLAALSDLAGSHETSRTMSQDELEGFRLFADRVWAERTKGVEVERRMEALVTENHALRRELASRTEQLALCEESLARAVARGDGLSREAALLKGRLAELQENWERLSLHR